MRELQIGRAKLQLSKEWLSVIFEDGAFVESTPNEDEQSYAMAAALGYGTRGSATLRMWMRHDLVHCVLAVAERKPFSPALWLLAHNAVGRQGSISGEDARCFALECLLNGHSNPEYPPSLLAHVDIDRLVAMAHSTLRAAWGEDEDGNKR